VTFLGHVISGDGIGLRPDSRLVNRVLKISAPRTQKEVQRFIGLVNFYGNKIEKILQGFVNRLTDCEGVGCHLHGGASNRSVLKG